MPASLWTKDQPSKTWRRRRRSSSTGWSALPDAVQASFGCGGRRLGSLPHLCDERFVLPGQLLQDQCSEWEEKDEIIYRLVSSPYGPELGKHFRPYPSQIQTFLFSSGISKLPGSTSCCCGRKDVRVMTVVEDMEEEEKDENTCLSMYSLRS